jgi:hypothetical protein
MAEQPFLDECFEYADGLFNRTAPVHSGALEKLKICRRQYLELILTEHAYIELLKASKMLVARYEAGTSSERDPSQLKSTTYTVSTLRRSPSGEASGPWYLRLIPCTNSGINSIQA